MRTSWKWLIGLVAILAIVIGFFIGQTTPIVKKKNIALTVVAQDGNFEIICIDALQIKAGENAGMSVAVQPQLGFNKAVKFVLTGGPAAMTTTWTGGDDTWDAGQATGNLQLNLSVPLDNSLVGPYALVLTGTSQ
jgi:hypothetical protein